MSADFVSDLPQGFAPGFAASADRLPSASPSGSGGAFAGHWRDPAARRADAAIHLAGATAAALGAAALLIAVPGAGQGGPSGPALAYALGLAALFPASALFQHGPAAWREVTIKLDHAAIHLKIAATFAMIAAVSGGEPGSGPAGPWLLGFGAATLRALGPARMRAGSLALHLGMMLGGLAAIWPALAGLSPEAMRLVLLGGAILLAGVLVHLVEGLRYGQAIWHALALAAAAAVYAGILTECAGPA